MESATSTNTGLKRLEALIALAMAKSARGEKALVIAANRVTTTAVSGATVGAGLYIVQITSWIPRSTGKLLVSYAAGWQAPGAHVNPFVTVGLSGGSQNDVFIYPQFGAVAAGIGGQIEVDGLTVGSVYEIGLSTTSGDSTITLGNTTSSTVAAASVTVQEGA